MAEGSIFYRMEQCLKLQGELPEDFILEDASGIIFLD